MMHKQWPGPMLMWAARDMMRKPVQSLLLFVVLAMLMASVSVLLLIGQVLSETGRHLLEKAPALVVRRVNAGGWAPLPVTEALACVRNVPGALNPRPRIWGVVDTPLGAVTVVGVGKDVLPPWPDGMQAPGCGEAIVGPGVAGLLRDNRLTLTGRRAMTLTIVDRLPADSSMAAHDLVLSHPDDARELLGLLPHQASDLALDVYHPEEARALCGDLAATLPWSVNITTRDQELNLALQSFARRTGLRLLSFLPAILALVSLSAAIGVWGHRRQPQNALFKAVGWTNTDLLHLQMGRCILVALPSLALGGAAAYLMLFWPGSGWFSHWVFDCDGLAAPSLYLSAQGAGAGFALAALYVGLPFFLACMWSGWHSTRADPADLLHAQPWGE